jgi:hypothetical protein
MEAGAFVASTGTEANFKLRIDTLKRKLLEKQREKV